jgi:hypothetical protein
MNLKDATVVLDGVFRHIPQKAIGIILQFSSVRRISFSTPPDSRAALVEQAKALYSEFSGAPESLKIFEFISACLSAAPEESDVVHDLLAYLAERMIEMNKEKNAEIKGFLRWLEGEIGAPVEELTNKTAIKEYYADDFETLAGALAKNKKKLKEGNNSTRREPKEKLQAEFNASVRKLAPLLKRIDTTDKLMDESISGGKDAKEMDLHMRR